MSESNYDLLFRGELLADADRATVQATLGRLLQLDDARLQQLFSGANVMIRRAADRETAARFQNVFRQAGARLRVLPNGQAAAAVHEPAPVLNEPAMSLTTAPVRKLTLAERLAAQQATSGAQPAFGADGPAALEFTSARAAGAATAAVRSGTPTGPLPSTGVRDIPAALRRTTRVDVPDYDLAPVGADLIAADERAIAPSAVIATDHISLAAAGGVIPNLVDPSRQVVVVQVPDLDVAPVGVDLGEVTVFVELPLDLSAFSLAPPGARLGLQIAQPSLTLDLSHLTLTPLSVASSSVALANRGVR